LCDFSFLLSLMAATVSHSSPTSSAPSRATTSLVATLINPLSLT
jgi:hypothetical protein